MAETDPNVRLDALERENRKLRSLLGQRPAELPSRPFPALSFERKNQRLALSASAIREVVHAVWPEPVADAPFGVLGRFVYEREFVTLVDLEQSQNEAPASIVKAWMVVVIVDCGAGLLGVLADRTCGVALLDPRSAVGFAAAPTQRYLASFLSQSNDALHLLSPRHLAEEFSR